MIYEYTVILEFHRGDRYTTEVLTPYHPDDVEKHEDDILALVIEQCQRDNHFAIIPNSWISYEIELNDVIESHCSVE